MPNAIFSGFKKFGDYLANSTEIIGQELMSKNVAGFDMVSHSWEPSIHHKSHHGIKLLQLAENSRAKCIVAMGMASDKKGLCIERTAVNRIYHPTYVHRIYNNTRVSDADPYESEIKLNIEPWNISLFKEKCLRENIPMMEISDDAGGFCCNYLMYQFRKAQFDFSSFLSAKIPFIFIHIPCCPEAIPDLDAFAKAGKITMPTEQVIRAITLLLETVRI